MQELEGDGIMGSSSETKEQTVASEKYQPALNDYYNERFKRLVERMSHNLPINRTAIIKRELEQIDVDNSDDQLESLKYASALSVLMDLSLQGWIFEIEDGSLTLKMENDNLDDKQKLRYRLSAEKNAQFKSPSVAAFIKQMESNKNYQGENISVRNLIGDKHFLIHQIQNGQKVCEPYIQLVTGKPDALTGYKLSDIWRYFRYTWSIPYKTMPGRNMFYLVRDRLQPYHPVIGMLSRPMRRAAQRQREILMSWSAK